MNVPIDLVPMAPALGLVAIPWSLKSGQYDVEDAALRVLSDDGLKP